MAGAATGYGWMAKLDAPAGEPLAAAALDAVHREVAKAAPADVRKSAKFMIPADAQPQLAYILERMPLHAPALMASEVQAAVEEWKREFRSVEEGQARRSRAPEWDMEELVRLSRGSPSLQLCKDLEDNACVLLSELSKLCLWRKEVFERRLLPLEHFTHFSVVCAQIARAKGKLHGLQSLLVSQVRALFVESKDKDALLLHKELLIRRDNQSTAQREIERMYESNSYLRLQLACNRALVSWTRILLTFEIQSLEKSMRMYQRDFKVYVQRLKDRTNIKNIVAMSASDLGVEDANVGTNSKKEGKSMKIAEVVRRQQALLKHVSSRVETHEEQVKLRESKLVHQQDKYREAIQEFEVGLQELQKKTSITDARALEVDAQKKRLEDDQLRLETVVKTAHKDLADVQDSIAKRFELLGSLERDVSHQAHAVEASAREQLLSLSKHAASNVASQAQDALTFAKEATAYITNTTVYPGETDWAKLVKSGVESVPASPISDAKGQGEEENISSHQGSMLASSSDMRMDQSNEIASIGVPAEFHESSDARSLTPIENSAVAVAAPFSALMQNPTVEAFSDYLEILDAEHQDELRVAILERRLQWQDRQPLDDQMQKRLDAITEKEDHLRVREIKCQVSEEKREALVEEIRRLHLQLETVTAHSQVTPDRELQIVAAQQAYRAIELELQDENLRLQVRFLQEKLTGTEEEKNVLKQVMESSANSTQVSQLAKEKQALINERQEYDSQVQALKRESEDLGIRRLEVDEKDTLVKALEHQVHAAIEKAASEQKAFENSTSKRMQELEEKERTVRAKLAELRAYGGDESKIEAILELKKTIAEKEKLMQDKDKTITRLEQELNESSSNVRDTVDALVDKATENLIKEMTRKEDKIEKREEAVSAQSSRLESEMARMQDAKRAEKALKDADLRLKRANEQLAMNNAREEELLALGKQIDSEREAIRKQKKQVKSPEEIDEMHTAYDHRIRGLNQQIKELKANEKQLSAKISRLETRSRAPSTGAASKDQSRLQTGDPSEARGWDLQYLDGENPTVDEIREAGRQLQEARRDMDSKIQRMESSFRSEYDVKAAELRLREEELDEKEAEMMRHRQAISQLTSKMDGLEDMTPDQISALRERHQNEINAAMAEYENVKAMHEVRLKDLEHKTTLAEAGFAKRVSVLASKSQVLDFAGAAQDAELDFDGQSEHFTQLRSLISSSDIDVSHLKALEAMYQERLDLISSQVQERTFLLEEQDRREEEAMRSLLKLVEDKEHEYLAQVAATSAHMAPRAAVRKDPEKVSSLPAIFPSLAHNPAAMRMGGGFSMNRNVSRTAPILRYSFLSLICGVRCSHSYSYS